MKRVATLAALFTCAACHSSHAQHAAATRIERCDYDVALRADGRARVQASCRADGPIAFRVAHDSLRSSVHGPEPATSGRFAAPRKQLVYEVELARLARGARDFDCALQVGASFVAPMSSVLLVPEPLTTEIPVTVRVQSPAGVSVAVGLTRGSAPDTYQLMAHEIPVATYFSFGKLEQRTLHVAGAELELARLDGALDQPFDAVSRWVEISARAVSDFYRAFPVPRASVTLIPVPERDGVVFGKVLPESQPGVALLVGEHVTHQALYSDWILVHELFHLGFPSFFEEGKWLDEGLATYYEPVIRVRAGLYTEAELWDELEAKLPQGLPAFTELGLERAGDFRGIYWGGAIACLVADVEARKRNPSAGLEVGLRALREAGGNACEVWSLSDAIATVDRALGAPTLAPIAEAHARRGARFDLKALLRELGVSRDARGAIQLSDAAPLAAVRRAITQP